jgi:hypothetical protein
MYNFEDELPEQIRKLYAVIDDLAARYPPLRFTLDGRLVGDIGEALARDWFGLELLGANNKDHEAKAPDGRMVQVKTTQRDVVGLGLKRADFSHLIVIKPNREGAAEVVYNGAGWRVWDELAAIKSCSIGVDRLRRLDGAVPEHERLPRVIP